MRVAALLDLDPATRRPVPALRRLVAATVGAVAGSLLADAVLVALGVALFPSTRGYQHFRFADYATLTVIGVLVACAGWPVVVRVCGRARWLFGWLAVLTTVVLLVPDIAILAQGQPARAVAVLMVMHVAIAVVTYLALVLVAPAATSASRPLAGL